jgi:Raf kinase inhibitor-like YbhB/YbcL family protein
MNLTSPAFNEGEEIPKKYTKYGANKIPPLEFSGVPEDAMSLAMIVDDPDAPNGTFTHWLVANLDPDLEEIKEDAAPKNAIHGKNDYGEAAYGGPKPPSGTHRYFFKAFALDYVPDLSSGSSREEFEEAIDGHIEDEAILMGTYSH